MQFHERLKSLRKSNKVTQKQIANDIGMSERNYQDIEYGNNKPSYEFLIGIADYFNVSLDYLAGRTDKTDVNK